jgi:hypothetical protein
VWKDLTSGLPGILVVISLAITGVWIVATLVSVVFPSHPVPATVNAVMGGMVTALFSTAMLTAISSIRKSNGRDDGKE